MEDPFRSALYINMLPNNLDLLQTCITELSSYLCQGSLTSVQLVQAYLDNIEQNNINGLGLRAVIQTAPTDSVLAIAKGLDEERQQGKVRGPLHGIPILIKDNIATDPELGMQTSGGNTALRDATVVSRLRRVGAIIIGKANMTELANYKGNDIPNGWSMTGGQTTSAYSGKDSSGRSSGSAVGVSAGFAPVSLGTETNGSIVSPASRAALYSIRPSVGLVPGDGIVPISFDLDSCGPMGFKSLDMAMVLDVILATDGKYMRAALSPTLRDLRLGLVRNNFVDEADGRFVLPGAHAETAIDGLLDAVEKLREAGAQVVDVNFDLNHADLEALGAASRAIMKHTFKEDLELYLKGLITSPIRSLQELIRWNEERATTPMEHRQEYLEAAAVTPGRNSEEYRSAKITCEELAGKRGLGYVFDKHNLDALVFAIEVGGASTITGSMGYALGTAPMSYSPDGAPTGILFAVKPKEEEKLISILSGYEALMPKRRVPEALKKR